MVLSSFAKSLETHSNSLAPFSLPDGRTFDVVAHCVRCVLPFYAEQEEEPLYLVEMECQERTSQNCYAFRVRFAPEIAEPLLGKPSLEVRRCNGNNAEQVMYVMARRNIVGYLLDHRYPIRFSNHFRPIVLEVT